MVEHLTQSQIKDFQSVFSVFDVNGDGSISRKEMMHVMRSLGQNPSVEEVNAMVDEVDTDGDGSVGFDEFVLLMSKKLRDVDMEEEITEAFRVFDKDNNNYITAPEIRVAIRDLGEKISDEELNELLEFADENGDGKIDYKEFSGMLAPR